MHKYRSTSFSVNHYSDFNLPSNLILSKHTRSKTQHFPLAPITQEYDVLYENQRGFYVLGIPKYSPNLLIPIDPPAWCDRNGKGVITNIQNHPLPDPTWEWVGGTWLVDMAGDVDPNGWQYAFRFSKHGWRGQSKLFHNFVRRRRWIRLRHKKVPSVQLDSEVSVPVSPSSESQPLTPKSFSSVLSYSPDTTSLEPTSVDKESTELTQQLNCSRVDREKLALIQTVIDQRTTPFTDEEKEDILNCLEFESSRAKLLEAFDEQDARCSPRSAKPQPASNPIPSSTPQLQLNSCPNPNPETNPKSLSLRYSDQPQEYIQHSSELLLQPKSFAPSFMQGTSPSLYLDAKSYLE